MCKFFNEIFTDHLDPNQFGGTGGRSTTLALIKFSHHLYKSLDRGNNFARILLVDFRKAFDLINQNILYEKMQKIKLPPHLTLWFLSFLHNRSQYVSVNSSCSSTHYVNAGTPQGTLSGPLDFNLLINDLSFDLDYLKYIDDTTATSVSDDPLDDALQFAADYLCRWCHTRGMEINVGKTKEGLIFLVDVILPSLSQPSELMMRMSRGSAVLNYWVLFSMIDLIGQTTSLILPPKLVDEYFV